MFGLIDWNIGKPACLQLSNLHVQLCMTYLSWLLYIDQSMYGCVLDLQWDVGSNWTSKFYMWPGHFVSTLYNYGT